MWLEEWKERDIEFGGEGMGNSGEAGEEGFATEDATPTAKGGFQGRITPTTGIYQHRMR